MKIIHVVVDLFLAEEGIQDQVLAAMVQNDGVLFNEKFRLNTESSGSVLDNLLAWSLKDVPEAERIETRIMFVICRPHIFYRLVSGFEFFGKHNCMCFATFVSAFRDETVDVIRTRYDITTLTEEHRLACIRQYASIFKDVLAISELVKEKVRGQM